MTYPIYVICRLLLGTLYPGFQSFKAVRTKNVREYVKWMMYWIVFSIYTGIESFSDIFISFWFPFYYEIKIVFLMWLLSPVAKGSLGSSIMYRKFVHPILLKKEEEIDKYVSTIGDQGYKTFWKYANEGFNFITRMVMQTAIKGGGGLITHLKRSYSLSDLATLDLCGSDTEEKRPITIQSLQEVDTGKVMVVREGKDNENQKRVNLVRRGPPTYLSGDISSGYFSTSEFLPVLGEVLDTEDYEVYDPRIHRRYTPISRNGSATSSVTGPQPGSHTRRKKEVSPYGTLPRSYALRKQVRKTVK
uniref:Receptor expression-enhancing protein n=1 Tax=Lepeophtheirus salmonis TaxID=72036 RepID=C1BTI9_LEPSM|nr:Receptor expression-enhancing protein 4 [Lepeophtheirus salmonis]